MSYGSMKAGGLEGNSKTSVSFDTTTKCPRLREGKPCAYCYVQAAREHGFRGKLEHEEMPYTRGVLRMRQHTIDRLNASGGIRMFAFADYVVQHRKWVKEFLDDCVVRGLRAKAITKQVKFIEHFHDHPALAAIHLSIDALGPRKGGSPVPESKAIAYRTRFQKVQIRAVALSVEEAKEFGKKAWVDILTLNHGQNGFHDFTDTEMREVATLFPDKVCCQTHVCNTCPVRCGVNLATGLPHKAGCISRRKRK